MPVGVGVGRGVVEGVADQGIRMGTSRSAMADLVPVIITVLAEENDFGRGAVRIDGFQAHDGSTEDCARSRHAAGRKRKTQSSVAKGPTVAGAVAGTKGPG